MKTEEEYKVILKRVFKDPTHIANVVIDGKYEYFGLGTKGIGKIIKIDLATNRIVDELIFDEEDGECYCLEEDGTYLYAGTNSLPGRIKKIALTTFSIVDTLILKEGENVCESLHNTEDGYMTVRLSPRKLLRLKYDGTVEEIVKIDGEKESEEYDTETLFFDGIILYAHICFKKAPEVIIDLATFTRLEMSKEQKTIKSKNIGGKQ